MATVNEWVITDKLPDGKNYFCGIGELKLPGGQVIKSNVWNKDIRQALPDLETMEGGAIFLNKRIAYYILRRYIRPNSPTARVERLRYSVIAKYKEERERALKEDNANKN